MTANFTDTGSATIDEAHPDVAESLRHALVNLVAREPGELAVVVDDDDLGLAMVEAGERLLADAQQLVVVAHREGSTRTLRKRHGAAP